MTLQQIRYLAAVVEYGSISEAAKKLYLSQSSVSSAVKDIESEYNITIFQRHSKGVILTREGEDLLIDLQRILEQMRFIEEKYNKKNHETQCFCISTQHHICGSDAFIKLLNTMKNSNYSTGFLECKTQEVMENVEKGISDIGVIFFTEKSKSIMLHELKKKDLIFNPIVCQKPHVYIGKNHPLAGNTLINSYMLEKYPFVTYDRAVSNSSMFTETIIPYNKIRQVICVTDRAAAYSILRFTEAFLVGSGYHSFDDSYGDIISIPLEDADNLEIGWIAKSKFILPNIIKLYINFLTEIM